MKLVTYPKKRIDIFIEAPLLNRVLETLDAAQVTGYTVIPALAGRGKDGSWRKDDSLNNSNHMVSVVCITDGAKADAVVEAVHSVVKRQIGITIIGDVSVVRSERF